MMALKREAICHLVVTKLLLLVLLTVVSAQDILFPGAPRPQTPTRSRSKPDEPQISCQPQVTCPTISNSRDMIPVDRGPCLCDNLCAEHGDCCLNAQLYDPVTSMLARTQWQCTDLRNYYGVFLKVACPQGWLDDEVRSLCETKPSERDPIRKLPMTSRRTQLSYKNYYCALCNGDMQSPIYWIPHLECGDKPWNFTFDRDDFWDSIHFNESQNSWGFVSLDGSFVACTIDPEMPSTVIDLVRRCTPFISDCSANWTDDSVRQRCYSYTSYMFEGSTAYRNADCGVCNYAETLSCVRLGSRHGFGKFNSHVFTMLFDVNERTGGRVGSVKRCDDTEIYDPFAQRCRNIICGGSNQVFRAGRCISVPSEEISSPKTTEPSTTTAMANDIATDVVVFPLDIGEEVFTETVMVPPEVDSTIRTTTVQTLTDFFDETNKITTTESEEELSSETDIVVSFPGDRIDLNETGSAIDGEDTQTDLPAKLNCQKFTYNDSDYLLFENGSVFLKVYNKVLAPEEFQQDSNKLYVCVKTVLGDNYSNYEQKFSAYLSIVSVVGLGISLLCLMMHLICFCLVPDLQNLSGKNLASLCIALFVGYIMFIIAQFTAIPRGVCTAVGVAMFFSFLSSFFWMNTMAFDVWRALRQATTELRVSSGQQWRKFVVYSAYSWLSPALIVGISVVIENVDSIPEEFHPGFGVVLCWFNNRRALLLFFVVPVVTVILLNVVLFSLSAYMIVSTTRNTARLHTNKPQRNFRLYLRLALLMGLTWIVGIIAALSDIEPLWHVFVAFNTLQGLFIFFAFTCTKKVLQSLCSKVTGRKMVGSKSSTFADSTSRSRMTKKSGLEPRDSADSQTSHTSRTSLTQTTSTGSSIDDTLY